MATKLPRIGKNVRIATKKKPARYGTIIDAVGPKRWRVQFDDGSTEDLSSAQLCVYKAYYNQHARSPLKDALKTVKKAVPQTIGRLRRRKHKSSIDGGGSSAEGSSKSNFGSDSDDSDEAYRFDNNTNSNLSSSPDSTILDETPKPIEDNPRNNQLNKRQLFSGSGSDSESSAGGSFDDADLEEDCDGADTCPIILPTEDGGEQVDFVDRPMAKAAYNNAYKIMKQDKKRLIQSEHTITKIVKTPNKYVVGAKVKGAPNTIKKDKKGTIIEVCDEDNFYVIEWDDDNEQTCRMEKNLLRLEKETGLTYKWTVVEDHIAPSPPVQYEQHGVVNFSMKAFNAKPDDEDYNHPFALLIEKLWPGSWREQLAKMNEWIRNKESGTFKEVTQDEWWTFWGIVIFAAKVQKGGVDALWDKGKNKLLKELPSIDMSDRMKRYRFENIKRVIPIAFHGEDEADPWNPIKTLIDGFNNNRARTVAASYCKVHDESMCSYKPRSTKAGGLPFLSFIMRKPKPFGTEFKCTACTETGECFAFYVNKCKKM